MSPKTNKKFQTFLLMMFNHNNKNSHNKNNYHRNNLNFLFN